MPPKVFWGLCGKEVVRRVRRELSPRPWMWWVFGEYQNLYLCSAGFVGRGNSDSVSPEPIEHSACCLMEVSVPGENSYQN